MNICDDTVSGVLVVDKAKGMTSHDVVNLVRRKFSVKKVGHAGTLDPQATGVLVLLVGGATKLSEKFSGEDKEYDAIMKLGERTDSGDSQGKIVSVKNIDVTEGQIREAIMSFMGETEQVPPMVSAKKIDGVRLYKLARKGIEVEREPRQISIREMEISGVNIPFVKFRVLCSKGTYIRQLAEDIGEKLGCGAHLTELRRTRSGAFAIRGAVTIDLLNEMDKETFFESITRI